MYKPDYYMPLLEFRDLTLKRLQHFADQRFFSVRHTACDCLLKVADGARTARRYGLLRCCTQVV